MTEYNRNVLSTKNHFTVVKKTLWKVGCERMTVFQKTKYILTLDYEKGIKPGKISVISLCSRLGFKPRRKCANHLRCSLLLSHRHWVLRHSGLGGTPGCNGQHVRDLPCHVSLVTVPDKLPSSIYKLPPVASTPLHPYCTVISSLSHDFQTRSANL